MSGAVGVAGPNSSSTTGSSTKPKPQTKSNAADLSAQINLDLPFFSQMLDLTAEQQVKLNLYLEFAVAGNIGRLKDMYVLPLPVSRPMLAAD